jgi:hypothetical protein
VAQVNCHVINVPTECYKSTVCGKDFFKPYYIFKITYDNFKAGAHQQDNV